MSVDLGKRSILIVSVWPPGIGGVSSFAARLACDPRFVARFDLLRHCAVKRPSHIFPADWPRLGRIDTVPRKVLSGLRENVRYLALVARHRPELVQIHYNGPFSGPLFREVRMQLRWARRFGARTLVRHGSGHHLPTHVGPEGAKRVRRGYVSLIDVLMIQWPALARQYRDWFSPAGPRVVVVPNAVDTSRFAPAVNGATSTGPLVVGCIAGPETEVKGAYVLLEALDAVSAVVTRPFVLDALASSSAFVDAVQRSPHRERVRCRPPLAGIELAEWYRSLDVFVSASLSEGFPNAVLEALSSGVAVLATQVGAVPFVLGESAGCSVPANDASALASALARLLEDGSERDALRKRGRQRATAAFALDGPWIEELLDAYADLQRPAKFLSRASSRTV